MRLCPECWVSPLSFMRVSSMCFSVDLLSGSVGRVSAVFVIMASVGSR